MKVNDAHVISELEKVKSDIADAYKYSNNSNCDRILSKVFGRLETLISILFVVEDE